MRNYLIIFFVLILKLAAFAGPKIDTVYFQSGDRITGELKTLENNLLQFSTSDAATLEVKWDRIDSLIVKQYLRIELSDGELVYANIYPSDSAGYDLLIGNFGIRHVKHLDIIRVVPFHKKFKNRVDGAISAGVSYTKATDLFRTEFAGSIKYSAERYISEANYNSSMQKQKDYDNAERHNLNFNVMRLLKNKWFYSGLVSSERNSELGLNLRLNLGVNFGNNLIFTNYTLLNGALGAQVNREFGVDSVSNNAEGVIAVKYSVFKYRTPKLTLSISANVYPNLQDFERVRFDTESNVRWELLKDFYLKGTLFYTYDSKPLSASASHEDFSTSFGIEYTF